MTLSIGEGGVGCRAPYGAVCREGECASPVGKDLTSVVRAADGRK